MASSSDRPERRVGALDGFPTWAHELYARLAIDSQIVLSGNVDDVHLAPLPGSARVGLRSTAELVGDCLRASGYQAVLRWHVVAGLSMPYATEPLTGPDVVGDELWERRAWASARDLADLLQAVAGHDRLRAGIVVEDAPRLAPGSTDADLHRVYLAARYLARTATHRWRPADTRPGLRNVVVWTVPREADLPAWLVDTDRVGTIHVAAPTRRLRLELCSVRAPHLPGYSDLDEPRRRHVVDRLADVTEGMSLSSVSAAIQVAIDRVVPADDVEQAVRYVRIGTLTSPWCEPSVRTRIARATDTLNAAVIGQERAMRRIVDVLSRAALGMPAAGRTHQPTGPRGVLFLAGPPGVGKTEVVKRVAEIVFGGADAMAHVDIGGFAAEWTDAGPVGSPAGWPGREAAGELTDLVRRRPFSLLLFDEVDKANPRVLDKVWRILDDGRRAGTVDNRVGFSEALIVFTANVEVQQGSDGDGPQLRFGSTCQEVEAQVRRAVQRTFLEVGRSDVFNRIRDGIVAFDFMDTATARQLLRHSLAEVAGQVGRRTGNQVAFGPAVLADLDAMVERPESLVLGGHAVRSVVADRVLDPLARVLLTVAQPGRYEVTRIWDTTEGAQVGLARLAS